MKNKKKVFKDPVHNYIYVDEKVIWSLINETKAFQRLNNIKQLGSAYQVFHGATHTRFGHSLGVYHIAKRMVNEVSGLKSFLSERDTLLFYTASLLHDIGHGPFSHTSEMFLEVPHEEMSCRIILEDEDVRKILDKVDENFALDTTKILMGTYRNKTICSLVSGPVDVDRMDYLLRDSYFAGVPYGNYDLSRILRVMSITDSGEVVFSESGIQAIEAFMFARHNMTEQVYRNTKGEGYGVLLKLSMLRLKKIYESKDINRKNMYKKLYKFLTTNKTSNLDDFLNITDFNLQYVQQLFEEEDDIILKTLARKLQYRDLYDVIELTYEEATENKNILTNIERIQETIRQDNDLTLDSVMVYVDFSEKEKEIKKSNIHILKKNNDKVLLEDISIVFQSLLITQQKNRTNIFFYREYEFENDQIRKSIRNIDLALKK